MVPVKHLIVAASLLLVGAASASHIEGSISWACGGGGYGSTGHPDNCGIDPIGGSGVGSDGEPTWGSSWIAGEENVLGVIVNGEAVAVPVKLLDRHEIVNANVGGVEVAITYCPLCGSGITFEREFVFDGQPQILDFAASGFLYNHDLVMWDPSGILWNQIRGEPIGTLVDEEVSRDHPAGKLTRVPTEVSSWQDWLAAHPTSTMLQKAPGASYGGAYRGYADSCSIGISGSRECDIDGIHPKEIVIGVDGARGAVAFVRLGFADSAFDSERGVLLWAPVGEPPRAYDAGQHEFNASGAIATDENGMQWDIRTGQRSDGSASLQPLDATQMYWFAWQGHHPDSTIWVPESAQAKLLHDSGQLPGFTIGIVAVLLVGIAAVLRWRR